MSEFEIQVLYYLSRIEEFCYDFLAPALVLILFCYVVFKLVRRKFML